MNSECFREREASARFHIPQEAFTQVLRAQ